MYKVVIIEDEEMIRKGLVYSIPWTDIGCTVVGQGRNGLEGIEQIRLHQPDIVIADINMPLLSGTATPPSFYRAIPALNTRRTPWPAAPFATSSSP